MQFLRQCAGKPTENCLNMGKAREKRRASERPETDATSRGREGKQQPAELGLPGNPGGWPILRIERGTGQQSRHLVRYRLKEDRSGNFLQAIIVMADRLRTPGKPRIDAEKERNPKTVEPRQTTVDIFAQHLIGNSAQPCHLCPAQILLGVRGSGMTLPPSGTRYPAPVFGLYGHRLSETTT
jgi:hypothetical protein